jgi:Ras-related protein Rab-8A
VVTTAEGQALADEYNVRFFETSLKQDINVDTAFVTIATDVKDMMILDGASVGPAASGHKIVLGKSAEQKKGCC